MLDRFKACDAEKVTALLESAEKSIEEVKAFISGGHWAAADIAAESLQKSTRELCLLAHAKREHDRLQNLARKLQQKNIAAEVIKCYSTLSI